MIRALSLCAIFLALAACGADGAPDRPDPRPAPGLTITGTVEMGVGGTL
jgi:hypothetical protein